MKNITKLLALLACIAAFTTPVFAQQGGTTQEEATSAKAKARAAISAKLPTGKTIETATREELAQAIADALLDTEDQSLADAINEEAVSLNFVVSVGDEIIVRSNVTGEDVEVVISNETEIIILPPIETYYTPDDDPSPTATATNPS